MSLKKYQEKKNFNKTSEPKGKVLHSKQSLYIIQKHAASHLHYDFRIELHGVLKSWAIPKGPCLDPHVKRLAIHVEDHPIAYGSFQGIIPKGEYGGGTVMLWDKGEWHSLDEDIDKAYAKGHLRFQLKADKLNGRWDLIRFKQEDKAWFLIKYQDEFAKSLDNYDICEQQPNSVLTQQSIAEISDHHSHVWTRKGLKKAVVQLPDNLKKSAMPTIISPQLATLTSAPPQGAQWLHEIKFDGYRIVAFKEGKNIRLMSRNNNDWTAKFSNVISPLRNIPVKNAIFDGEIVVLDEANKSNFQLLQNALDSTKKTEFIYYIFDLLYYEAFDIRSLPLLQRKNILADLIVPSTAIRYSDHILDDGQEMFKHSCAMALEGIVSKRIDSRYIEKRSKSWLKIKCSKRQEFVIGGYTPPQGERKYFGSLYLGYFDDQQKLIYCGNVGTGFSAKILHSLFNLFEDNRIDKNPFNSKPPNAKKAIWINPILVAEIEFSQWTSDNKLRHPSFQGLRYDKKASNVAKERELPVEKIIKSTAKKNTIKLTHPEKILFKEDSITKQDLYDYYDSVSKFILPFIRKRPLTLVRCPDNYGECFYQKHFNKTTSNYLHSVDIMGKSGEEEYIYLEDKKGLLSLVQMGVLEIHPWGSLIKQVENPDMIIIDLDPAPDVMWKKVVEAAFEIKSHFAQLKLASFVKTTGGKGLHVVIPIKAEHTWDEIKQFTQVFVETLESINPATYVSKMAKAKRKGKIFVDYLRNQRGATAVSAYSSRARLHAPVSTPMHWDELSDNYADTFFTIYTLPQRLETLKVDPWEDFFKIKQRLKI